MAGSDIRSWFGGSTAHGIQPKHHAEKAQVVKKSRGRKVLDESDEDQVPKKSTPVKASKPKRQPTPEVEVTTTSDYFGKEKPKKTAPTRTANRKFADSSSKESPKAGPRSPKASVTPEGSGRTPSRREASGSLDNHKIGVAKIEDDEDGKDDIFAAEYTRLGMHQADDYEEGDEDGASQEVPSNRRSATNRKKKRLENEEDFKPEEDVDMRVVKPRHHAGEEEVTANSPTKSKKPAAKAGRKRKSQAIDEEEEDEDDTTAKKSTPKVGNKKSPAKKKPKNEEVPESAAMQAIFDSIPTIRPPTPPSKDAGSKKFDFSNQHANAAAAPAGAGSKEIPEGAENCLAGLSFVFTGILDTLGREQGTALVKRYGGKVMTAPSSRTTYVVLGADAGPKKLQTIRDHKLKTINEDGLFELIRRLPANGGDSKAAAKADEKRKAEEEKIEKAAAEAEREEQENLAAINAAKRRTAAARGTDPPQSKQAVDKALASGPDTRLWTVKHAPAQISQICGNKAQVERLQRWLRAYPKNQRTGFKLAGPDASGTFRAILIHGPPGIGKTTAAHLVAKLEGYDVVESNASDTRSKKLVEQGLKGVLSTTSLLGYFAGDGQQVNSAKKKLVLIMDEVDGMSAGDRGGVGALAAVCKKTQVPMILICNDRRQPKMKPFDFVTFDLQFRRPTTEMIRSRIMTIGYREGIKLPPPVVDALIEGTGGDIRQVVNMLSTAKIDQDLGDETMDYNRGKEMSKAWEKHIVMKPFDIVNKILASGMFAGSSKSTLNDKIELYFNDHELSSLMLAENYLNTSPSVANHYSGREKALKLLECAEKAANSISEGDLVDRLIHGPEQQWSLMPTHAVFGFVRPASFVAGSIAGHGGTRFPQWLGKNSSMGKSSRQIKEIQGHMRLRASGDRHEIRQQYVPLLWSHLVKKLEVEGKDSVPVAIDLMDSYFLTKDDWEAILELGIGPMAQETVKLESQTKATFTRLYNAQNHPLPFMKASNVVQPKKQTKEKPDLEEAIEESDEGEVEGEDVKMEDEEDELDLKKDKYVAQPKKQRKPPAKSVVETKGKQAKKVAAKDTDEDGEDDDDDDSTAKPRKGKGGVGSSRAKSKGKK